MIRSMKRKNGTLKFTVTVPADLFEWGEEERKREAANRSEFVTSLYRARRQEQIARERQARYEAAYAAQPPTLEEREWIEAGGDALADLADER